MKKTLLGIFIFILIISKLEIIAQTSEDSIIYKKYKHNIGIEVGTYNNNGISYRFWPSKFGFQAKYLSIKNESNNYHNFGFSVLYKMFDSELADFLLYQSNQFINSEISGSNNRENKYNFTFGIGFETIEFERLSGNLLIGLHSDFKSIEPDFKLGIFYMF